MKHRDHFQKPFETLDGVLAREYLVIYDRKEPGRNDSVVLPPILIHQQERVGIAERIYGENQIYRRAQNSFARASYTARTEGNETMADTIEHFSLVMANLAINVYAKGEQTVESAVIEYLDTAVKELDERELPYSAIIKNALQAARGTDA